MNHKQKLGYMALGAGIMVVGIIIGQIITPDIEAQSNGVFDIIRCRQLQVVDENGKIGIMMASSEHNDHIILGGVSKGQVFLSASETTQDCYIALYDPKRNTGIRLSNNLLCNTIDIYNKTGERAISLTHTLPPLDRNRIKIHDEKGNVEWIAP